MQCLLIGWVWTNHVFKAAYYAFECNAQNQAHNMLMLWSGDAKCYMYLTHVVVAMY